MGKLEQKLKEEIRKSKVNSAIINTIAAVGIISIALVAPKVMSIFKNTKYFRQKKFKLNSSFSKLVSAGYIKISEENGEKYAELTKKGQMYVALLGEDKLKIKKPKKWDKKWRVLIFDIPEERKKTRDKIRITLISLGFVRLQDSVWVYPYDCEDLITLLKADLRIGKDVLYMIVDKIENDGGLRETFGLGSLQTK